MFSEENYDDRNFGKYNQKTVTKICEFCKTPYKVPLKYSRRKIYCSYLCGQKAFLYKNGFQLAKEIRALKKTCSIKGCKEKGSSFIRRNILCQDHYWQIMKQLKSKKATSVVLVLKQ